MRPDRFLDAVQSLIDEPIGAELLGLGPAVAVAALRDGTFAMLVSAGFGEPEALEAVLRDFVRDQSSSNLKLIVIGGDEQYRRMLQRVQPSMMLGRVVQAFALDDSGTPWAGARSRLDSPIGVALATVGAREQPRAIDPAALASLVAVPSATDRAHGAAARAFVESTRRGVPIVTLVILGLVGVMFGLEWWWGGTEFVPTLVRMGANGTTAYDGEPWRLLSCAWLHAGPLHVLVNAYVLYSLGGFLERLLGGTRLVVLYAAAALGGGLASAALSDAGLSVGASGAIWGLLGASVALAWRPAGLIPAAILPAVRRNALVNVVINLAVSFMPAIDVMAHLGGGLVGAGLVLAGVLTAGVTTQPRGHRGPWAVAAAIAALAMLSAPIIAMIHDRPWAIFDDQQVTHPLGQGATIELPAALGPITITNDGAQRLVEAGQPLRDRGALTLVIEPIGGELGFPEELEQGFAEFSDVLTGVPDGAEVVGGRRLTDGARHRGFEEHFRFDNGLEILVTYQLHLTAKVRVEAVFWSAHPEVAQELRTAANSLTIP